MFAASERYYLQLYMQYRRFISAPNVGERFKSPVVTAVARRQLAFDSGDVSPQGSPMKGRQQGIHKVLIFYY